MSPELKQALDNFFQKYRLVKFKKGELIYRPGDDFSHISYIKTGYVRLYNISKDGKEKTIHIFKPVFYLSLIYALCDLENKYYFEAVTPVELWRAPKDEMLSFLKGNPTLLFDLVKTILTGYDRLLTNIESLISGGAQAKIASLLLSLANSFGKVRDNKTILDFEMTHTVIASLTGLTRETVCTHMNRFEKKGWVSHDEKLLVIENLDELKRIAEI